MTISTKWRSTKGPTDAEYWVVGKSDHGFRPTVNITTEDLAGAAQGIAPETYLKLSIRNLQSVGFKVLKQGLIRGVNSSALGAIEYTGKAVNTGLPLHMLAIIDLNEDTAVVATMASSQQSFARERAALQPYLRTLQASGKST